MAGDSQAGVSGHRKRPRAQAQRSADTAAPQGRRGAARTLYHYPSSLPFPVLLDDDFPREPYRSRGAEVKTAVHWGQRKLLLSEMQLLCLYCKPDTTYHIVYVGSAPGTHLGFLDDLFDRRHTWELVDPGQFDRRVLASRANFTLRNEFFTNATAYGIVAARLRPVLPALAALYAQLTLDAPGAAGAAEVHRRLQSMVGTLDVARGTEDIPAMYEPPVVLPRGLRLLLHAALEARTAPMLFVSDIRSGSVTLPNFEEHVAENMQAQACWTTILHAEYSMLKFRLPYTTKATGFGGAGAVRQTTLIRPDGTVPYLRGELLLPIWTRPTSTEGRLVVRRGAREVDYDVAKVENQFFFFNARVREQVHFNHLLCDAALNAQDDRVDDDDDDDLDHHYDAAAEVNCLRSYLLFKEPALRGAGNEQALRTKIREISASITAHLGLSFADVIRRREVVVRNYSRQQPAKRGGDGSMGEQGTGPATRGEDDREKDTTRHVAAAASAAIDESPRRSSWEQVVREMQQQAAQERRRAVWHRNVDETAHHTASGFWVTTTMPQ